MTEIKSGNLEINFNGNTYQVDLMLLKLVVDDVEADSPPKAKDGFLTPTPDMLRILAARLESDFGIEGATPTAAYQLWFASAQQFAELKKNIDEMQKSPTGSTSTPTL